MYYDDHAPPHVHAKYAEHEAQVGIATGELLHGWLPRPQRVLVRTRDEREEPLVTIEPLP